MNNGELREKLVTHNDAEILCLIETHLQGTDKIDIPNYVSFCLNRNKVKQIGRKGSGGVAILVQHSILKHTMVRYVASWTTQYWGLSCVARKLDPSLSFSVFTFPQIRHAMGKQMSYYWIN